MKLLVERLPESQVLLDIAADDDEFAKAMERAYRQVGRQVVVPGFRRGKAPRGIIERQYGRSVFLEEANKELMTDLYRRALEQEALRPVGEPEVEVVATEPLAFKVTVPVYPTVDPGAYTEVRLEPIDAAVDEAAVDEAVEALRRAESPWVDPAEGGFEVGADLVLAAKKRTPRDGDQVTIDYRVREGEETAEEPVEDAVFVLGESGLLDQLEERIRGLNVGESASFDIAFGEDDATVDRDLQGKTLAYDVTLKGLKEKELLPLDDDFARNAAEVETLAELRGQIRDDLHQRKTAEARSGLLNQTITAMAEVAEVPLPGAMIDEAVAEDLRAQRARLSRQEISFESYLRLMGQTEEELMAELRPAAERRLRNSLVLREIAKREGIAIEETDLDSEVDRLSAAAAAAPDPRRVEQLYRSGYFRDVLRNDLFERRLSERLLAIATEGRGAVVNGWVEPKPAPEAEPGPDSTVIEGEAVAGVSAATLPTEGASLTGDAEAESSGTALDEGPGVAQAADTTPEDENVADGDQGPAVKVTATADELPAESGEPVLLTPPTD